MVDKLRDYQGPIGQLHTIRDNVKSNFTNWKENHAADLDKKIADTILRRNVVPPKDEETEENFDFSHIRRKKTRLELLRLCVIVAGIEFSYSAITAFSSPILLEIGVKQSYMTMVFSLSPLLGFFLSPVCGSLSDRCTSKFGRRRIFIVAFSIFELLGLFLIPYGQGAAESASKAFSDSNFTTHFSQSLNLSAEGDTNFTNFKTTGSSSREYQRENGVPASIIIVTILGIVVADHCADALQNPSRAYLLDVCDEADHTRGLSTFTILAGCGGTVGYGLGAVDWDSSILGSLFGGHIKTVFTLTAILFVCCVLITITTFKEVPLDLLSKINRQSSEFFCRNAADKKIPDIQLETLNENGRNDDQSEPDVGDDLLNKGVRKTSEQNNSEHHRNVLASQSSKEEEAPSLSEYLSSIVKLPYSLRILLLTNVLCWMSHVSYSLYFTDYVGEAIFGGNPKAPLNSADRSLFEKGIRFACIGMSIYSFSCMLCSLPMEKAIKKFGVRQIYMANITIDSISMGMMFYFNTKEAALIFSFASGILYCTIFTIPYIIVARYHTLNVFEVDENGEYVSSTQVRGLGTDIAIIGSSVFIAQFFLSLCIGFIISWYGSTSAVPLICSILSLAALVGASKVMYLDL